MSAALAQLQRSITLCALFVFACATVQVLVFGFVHFTQVRYNSGGPAEVQSLSVVGAPPPQAVAGPRRDIESLANNENRTATPAPEVAASTPRPLSLWDPALHMASDSAVTIGVISTLALMALTLLGVVVAAGNATPGVDRAASACAWALVLGLSCIPWSDVFTSVPFPGVFGGYATMTWLSHAVDAGTGSVFELICLYLVAPIAVMGASILILLRFRAGVADGFIVTSVSELDDRLEREMATIRSRGVQAAGIPRTVAALNHAIGDRPVEAPVNNAVAAAAEAPRSASTHPPRVGRSWGPLSDRTASARQDQDEDDGGRRPI